MQESRGKFESQFFKLLSEDLAEENISVGGGALGTAAQGGTIFNPDSQINSADTYAPGDARKPKMLGGVQTRSGSASKKKKIKRERCRWSILNRGRRRRGYVSRCLLWNADKRV